ncbi:MAG: hypothetical protein CVV34_07470, partial [Methanomicrobiales archaeon HGW-Methanomicrobiales-5]
MIKRFIVNPFLLYVLSFLIIFLLYQLKWSNSFSILNENLIYFLIATVVISFFFGVWFDKYKVIKYYPKTITPNSFWITMGLMFLYLIEFIYSRHIPLIEVLTKNELDLNLDFGIPVLHPLIITFNSYYIVRLYNSYLSFKKKKYLVYMLICLLPGVLLVSRLFFVAALISIWFITILYIKRIRMRVVALFLVSFLGIGYLFGLMGNHRSLRGSKVALPIATNATNDFLKSDIPKEYYWIYIYSVSSLGNLNLNVENGKPEKLDLKGLLVTQALPDFISKRIIKHFNMFDYKPPLVYQFLNTSTLYSASFGYGGWIGM